MKTWVRVGNPPGIYEASDRWGRPAGTFYVNECGWMERGLWDRVQDFQSLPPEEWLPRMKELVSIETAMDSTYGREVERKLQLSGFRTIWEMNLLMSDPDRGGLDGDSSFHRMVSIFGRKTLVEWSWFDIHVRQPLYRALAWLKTAVSCEAPQP